MGQLADLAPGCNAVGPNPAGFGGATSSELARARERISALDWPASELVCIGRSLALCGERPARLGPIGATTAGRPTTGALAAD